MLITLFRKRKNFLYNFGFLGLFAVLAVTSYLHGYLLRRLGSNLDLLLFKTELDFSMLFYVSIFLFCCAVVCDSRRPLARLGALLLFTATYLVAFGDLYYFRLAGTYLDINVAFDNTGYTLMGLGVFFADRWLIIYFLLMCVNIATIGFCCLFRPDKFQRWIASFLFCISLTLFALNLWSNRASNMDLAFSLRPLLAFGDLFSSEPLKEEDQAQLTLKELLKYRESDPAATLKQSLVNGIPVFIIALESVTPIYTMDSLAKDSAMLNLRQLENQFPVYRVSVSGAAHTMNGLIALLCGQLTRSEALRIPSDCLPRVLQKLGYTSHMWNVFNKMERKHQRVFERMGFRYIYDSRVLTERDGLAPLPFMYDGTLYDYVLKDLRAKQSLDHGLYFVGTNQTHFPGYSDDISCRGSDIVMKKGFEDYESFFRSARCADRNLNHFISEVKKLTDNYVIVVTADHPIDIGLGDIRLSDIGQVPLAIVINDKSMRDFFDTTEDFFELGATYDVPTLVSQLLSGEARSLGIGLGPLSRMKRDYVVSISSTCKLGFFGEGIEEYATCIPFARNLGMRVKSKNHSGIPNHMFENIFEATQ